MNTKHAPGPWTRGTSDDGRECVWLDANGEPEEGMGETGTWIDCNTEGNARLIAKSPEMLDMLIKLRKEFAGLPRSLGYDFTHLPKLDALIAEASGEQA